jgi:hypothetical protein
MIGKAAPAHSNHSLRSSVVVFKILWNGNRTVDMTRRRNDTPVIVRNRLSANVSKEKADFRVFCRSRGS